VKGVGAVTAKLKPAPETSSEQVQAGSVSTSC
jgi:hypothetical protein